MVDSKDKPMSNGRFIDKIWRSIQDNIILILIGGGLSGYNGYKEYTEEDRKQEIKSEVVYVVKEDMKDYLDSLMDERFMINLKKSLDDPMIWYDALSSDFVREYADKKASSIRKEVSDKLIELDSIQGDLIKSLGESLGIRDEKVIPLFEKMMKDYIKRSEIRTVTAPF